MTEDNIGRWARRHRLGGKPTTLSHLVESEIADRLVMRCGRQMKSNREQPFEFSDAKPTDCACFWCSGPRTVVVE